MKSLLYIMFAGAGIFALSSCEKKGYPAGIQELEQGRLAIYPNPAKDYCVISGEGLNEVNEAFLVDALGRSMEVNIVKQQNQWQLSLKNITSGCYTLVVADKKGRNYRGNIIVMK